MFLVNSVALVDQQSQYISSHTTLSCVGLCGADNVDNWTDNDWRRTLDKYQVLVMVHQVFLDLLNRGFPFFNLTHLNLLVIDECHHAIGNSPYSQVALLEVLTLFSKYF